jgi:hypothetical protein
LPRRSHAYPHVRLVNLSGSSEYVARGASAHFTIGLNIGEDGKILIHIRIPEDEGFTINEAERFRDLLDKQITVARSMSDGEENTRRFRT